MTQIECRVEIVVHILAYIMLNIGKLSDRFSQVHFNIKIASDMYFLPQDFNL